jgi:hypothetical protein
MTSFAQAILFLSSYSPLLAVFALLDTFGRGVPSGVCGAFALLGAAALPVLLRLGSGTAPQTLQVAKATPRDADTLAYIASYLVPFATVQATSGRERIAVGLFIAMIAVLYVRAELFYVNPLLALFGIRIFAVETLAGTPLVLLCRRRFVQSSSALSAVRISDYVWRERP